MRRLPIIGIIILLPMLSLMFMTGCAGPRYGIHSILVPGHKDTVVTSKPPENANLVISSKFMLFMYDAKANPIKVEEVSPLSETKRILSTLQKALIYSEKFRSVSISDAPITNMSDLQFVVDTIWETRAGWFERTKNSQSSVSIRGTLKNFDNSTLISFDKVRNGQGGLLGLGGLATVDEDSMIESLTGWVVDDIVDDIKAAFNK